MAKKEDAKDTSVIPNGYYCYTSIGRHPNGRMKIKTCPYWSADASKPEQQDGYCAFLGKGDWMENGTDLLWDMVKECGIKENDDSEKEE